MPPSIATSLHRPSRTCLWNESRTLTVRIEADLFSSFQQVPSSHLDILTVSGRAPPPPVTPPHQEEALEIVESSDTVHVPPLGNLIFSPVEVNDSPSNLQRSEESHHRVREKGHILTRAYTGKRRAKDKEGMGRDGLPPPPLEWQVGAS
ncbi:hypothetical protein F2Q69_00055147 [Brassica cretica]|uniref:Uncharacterized protein n=1 Tax=Brassica cretica TaxID=69181 RepID=A0A8S9MXK2_BRACR|nr:hypothetical protein F2Q69_00055147 [Brassica cretica]